MSKNLLTNCRKLLFSFIIGFLSIATTASACPDIDGLVDMNCDARLVIAAFGDSITYGVGDSLGIGYPGRLLGYFPRAIVHNRGVPGEDTVIGRNRAIGVFNEIHDADYAIVLQGVNDYWLRNRNSTNTANNLFAIDATAKRTGTISLLSNLTAVKRGFQKGWVSSVNSKIFPHNELNFFSLGESVIGEDLLHPDSFGYDSMTEHLANTLFVQSESNRPADSDLDGIYDFAEPRFGSDPALPDTDGDGLLDGVEITVYGSNPTLVDSDGDSFSDAFEVQQLGSNPIDPRPGAPRIIESTIIVR